HLPRSRRQPDIQARLGSHDERLGAHLSPSEGSACRAALSFGQKLHWPHKGPWKNRRALRRRLAGSRRPVDRSRRAALDSSRAVVSRDRAVYAGYVGWRGVVEESAIPARVRDCLGVHYYFALPPGEMMLCYPVPGRDNNISPGHRDWNYVWYRPTATQRELRDLCTDINGRYYGTAMPP